MARVHGARGVVGLIDPPLRLGLRAAGRLAGRLDHRILDPLLALAVVAWVLAESSRFSEHTRLVPLLVAGGALAARRRWPLGTLVVVAGCVGLNADGDGGLPEIAGIVIAVYSAALHSSHRLVVLAVVLLLAAATSAIGGGLPVPDWSLPFLVLVPVWLAGAALRRRERRVELWANRATRLEHERELALRAERVRIARELHDVVTHAVSVMVLQTGAARQLIPREPERAETLLSSVEGSGRSALDELRRLLGLLSDADDDAPLAPQPGVAQLDALVTQVRHAGLPVELTVQGEPTPLAAGVDLAAYRIVQEALTNTLKHAGRCPTSVTVRYRDDALELEILDEGEPSPGSPAAGGRGLIGMRERVAIYGGIVAAGPQPGRGFAVRARLPRRPT